MSSKTYLQGYNSAIRDVCKVLEGDNEYNKRLMRDHQIKGRKLEEMSLGDAARWRDFDTRLMHEIRVLEVFRARISDMAKGPQPILPDDPLNIKMERPE